MTGYLLATVLIAGGCGFLAGWYCRERYGAEWSGER